MNAFMMDKQETKLDSVNDPSLRISLSSKCFLKLTVYVFFIDWQYVFIYYDLDNRVYLHK